ncbi:pyridoxamine 5'-phosphate oxidase [Kiloniella litopenaei]|uniref:pyridoxamine 5'-phosphate oxidase n=1 Tax=Kiloniella litopenaei TaxID=1549748 RepID=UPI003BAC7C27
MDIGFLREDYNPPLLRRKDLFETPFPTFKAWLEHAIASKLPEPNAMTLTTTNLEGQPSARMVLLKEWTEEHFTFFTNYQSGKATQMEQSPKVCLLLAWPVIYRQIIIQGTVAKAPEEVSHAYFQTRPRKSQIAAWASDQSRPIDSREALEKRFKEVEDKFAKQENVSLPPHWGGYHVKPQTHQILARRERPLTRLL